MGRLRERKVRAWVAWIAAGVCLAWLAAGTAAAEDRPAVVVTPGKRQTFEVAVQRFADASTEAGSDDTVAFRESLSQALVYSNVFEIISPKAYLGPDRTENFEEHDQLRCADWTQIGADAFVEGELRRDATHFTAEFRLWDTARCKRLLRKRFRQGATLAPDILAKRIADDIVATFIGVRGVASTEMAFVSDRTGSKEIYLMDADGGRQRAVTANHSINNFPGWSPDGGSIVFTSYRHRNQPTLFVTTRGYGEPRRLLAGLRSDRSQYRGVFDPIGKYLAVVMSDGGPSEIYSVRPSARKIRRLTTNEAIDVSPTWSPTGDRIAFVSDRSGSPQIYVMDSDGDNVRRLTFDGSYNTGPTWSPDGRWIAYEARVGNQFDIWLIDPDGRSNVPLVMHPRSDEAPSWSPNSRMIAFSSNRRGRSDIYVIDLGGGEPRRLTAGVGNNTSPAWGPFPR